ncbi:protein-L-isoaspartate O-methyltransferase [Martensiomyces pterosporus]|nr:protein-L-isoaspartate O-methyltransferase [Martensiomyces pterosporus]
MAWRCSGRTNAELVDNLARASIIKSADVVSAMRAVDRGHFTKTSPYEDSPQYIGYGATISAPHMHGYALEYLRSHLQPGMRALDVGSGSGYLTACMAAMVGENGRVVGIDHIDELTRMSNAALEHHYPEWVLAGRIHIVTGDGRKGYPQDAPYDCIHVGAASPSRPGDLLAQLKSPGRMFVPVGTSSQSIIMYDKDAEGNVSERSLMGVIYVPLTDEAKQRDGW